MPSPFLKNFGTAADIATSVSKSLISGTEEGNPGGDGTYTQATISTTGTPVEHTLGRPPDGWVVIDNDTDATVWRSGDKTSTQIVLSASAECNVALWIF